MHKSLIVKIYQTVVIPVALYTLVLTFNKRSKTNKKKTDTHENKEVAYTRFDQAQPYPRYFVPKHLTGHSGEGNLMQTLLYDIKSKYFSFNHNI